MKRRAVRAAALPAGCCILLWTLLAPGLAGLLASGELGGMVRYVIQGAAEGCGLHNLGHAVMGTLLGWRYVWMNPGAAALTALFWALGTAAAWGLYRAGRRAGGAETEGEKNGWRQRESKNWHGR